jgi:hypothetical protein
MLIGIGSDFSNKTPITQEIRTSIDQWDFIKLKHFCTKKEPIKVKRKPTEWQKIFASYSAFVKKINNQKIERAQNLIIKRTIILINKWVNELNTQFFKRRYTND